jgi:hypothetical protein
MIRKSAQHVGAHAHQVRLAAITDIPAPEPPISPHTTDL